MNAFIKTLLFVSLIGMVIADGEKSKKKEIDGPVIGIDLGTTYSCVGIFKNGRVEIIPNELGNRITPSQVAFTDDEKLVGEAAKNQGASNPLRTVYVIKRLVGRKFDDKEVQRDMKYLPYKIVSKGGKPYVSIDTPAGNK
jgi:endoplasmic reticulum chaperone BiP